MSAQLRMAITSLFALSLALPCRANPNVIPANGEQRDFLSAAAYYDFGTIWRHDRQHQEFFDSDGKLSRRVVDIPANETIGFVGPNHQRFYIRYTRVLKDPDDPYLYRVTGKTRMGFGNITDFVGTLRIRKAILYKSWLYEHHQNNQFVYGDIEAEVLFKEGSKQRPSGLYRGLLRSSFHLVQGVVYLVTTDEAGDFVGQTNNHQTTWTDTQGNQEMVCSWTQSDWIPGGEALLERRDDRVAYVREAYYPYGWRSYGIRQNGYSSNDEYVTWESADDAERKKWWLTH